METNTNVRFERITREDSEQLDDGWRNCVHIMIYTSLPQPVYLFDNPKICIKKTILVSSSFDVFRCSL